MQGGPRPAINAMAPARSPRSHIGGPRPAIASRSRAWTRQSRAAAAGRSPAPPEPNTPWPTCAAGSRSQLLQPGLPMFGRIQSMEGPAPPMPHFTVLTVNTHKGFTAFNRRFILHELREAVRAVDADIVF